MIEKHRMNLENMQLLGISYFNGKYYYKCVRCGMINPENGVLTEELQTIIPYKSDQ